MQRSVIINVTLKGQAIDTYVLVKPQVVIGRDQTADILLDNPSVSRQHASIEIGDQSLMLRDLASASGTLVNGERATCCELKNGDIVHIGRFDLEIRLPQVIDRRGLQETRLMPPPGATIATPLPRTGAVGHGNETSARPGLRPRRPSE